MMTTPNFPELPPLKTVIEKHGLFAKKSLGQNFLMNPSITDFIAQAAGDITKDTVIEVGPGPGGLTRSLLRAGAQDIIALEKDERCVRALSELSVVFPGRLKILEQDALAFNYTDISKIPISIIANLPYNIATPLLVRWLSLIANHDLPVRNMTLMFQREVAQRITATPGTKSYGRLSIISQWLCDTYKVCDLPPEAFTPPPKVHSMVVGFKPLETPRFPASLIHLEAVTAAAFGQRRKMLRQSLKKLPVPVDTLLEKTGIDGRLRGDALAAEDFGKLARALEQLGSESNPP
jgi:16S rRNA (adenine1518-N6/adenine1519-N6)-dimethyltransferase